MKGAMCQSSPLNQPGAQASAGCFIDWAAAVQVHPCGAGLLRQFRRLDALCDLIGRNLRACSTAHNLSYVLVHGHLMPASVHVLLNISTTEMQMRRPTHQKCVHSPPAGVVPFPAGCASAACAQTSFPPWSRSPRGPGTASETAGFRIWSAAQGSAPHAASR